MSAPQAPTPPPPLPEEAHKGTAGRLLCLCGSATMPGAAQLVLRAAQRAGAGLVTLGVFQRELIAMVAPGVPEATYLDLSRTKDLYAGRLPIEIAQHQHDARLAGPGLGSGGVTRELVRRLTTSRFSGPLLLDADALHVVGGGLEALVEYGPTLVLTPHPGEAAHLLERTIPDDDEGRLSCAHEIAIRAQAICILKGARTIVTDGERHWVNHTGNPGMATAGSGDVLAGIVGAYLAAAVRTGDAWSMFDAACAGVHAHGLAGDLAAERLGQRGVIASDMIAELGAAQRQLAG